MRAWVVCLLLAACVAPPASLEPGPSPSGYLYYHVTEPGIHLPVVFVGWEAADAAAAEDALRAWGWSGPFSTHDVCIDCPTLERAASTLAAALAARHPDACMTLIANGTAGLAVRWMLAHVEERHAAYPGVLCVKVAATIATPHDCGLCPSTDQAWLARNATEPIGSGGTDWYTFGTNAAHLGVQARHAVRYVDGAGLLSAEDTFAAHAFYSGIETRQAPWPLHWLHKALTTDHSRWAPQHVNTAPSVASQSPPPGTYTIAFDGELRVTATCGSDLEGDRVSLVFRVGTQEVHRAPALPGQGVSYTLRFSEAGSRLVTATCTDGRGAAGAPATWTVTTQPRPTGTGPNIEQVDPPAGTYTASGPFTVWVECAADDGAEVRFIANGSVLRQVADAPGMSPTHEFHGKGTVYAAAMCVDEHGRHGPSGRVDWQVTFA